MIKAVVALYNVNLLPIKGKSHVRKDMGLVGDGGFEVEIQQYYNFFE